PCVILTEVDFAAFDERIARKLFVGATRATMKLIIVASQRAARLSRTQYTEGAVSYLDVIDGERQVLSTQLQASHLQGTQAVATVNLIRALGGGWGDAPASGTAVGSAAPAATP
ncbi:hypothetical protein EN817_31995, partial [Mesorhizobium sp. M3A.F.Ca.ET.174.01.1.1]|uniref:ATP-binding domain-containing protein n=1 Tax=Mesorhizobium sp. M3A.F.Ca.ET.174.01.1.1 TaxID=2563944 RepID=UPI001133A49C